MAAPFYNPFGTANYSRGRGSPMDGDPLSPGARQIVNRVRQGEDAAMRAAANFDPIDDEIKTTNERRTNLRLQREGMKNTLSNFLDTDGADMFERDELTNKPRKNPDGSMIPRLGLEVESLRKQSQQKTGLIAGALSPTKQRGDDTEEAKVAQRRLAEIEPTYKLKQEKYDRIQNEMKRIDDADISHENRLAELGRMREARYTVTPEDVQQAVTQVNTSRAATGQAPVSAKDLSQGKAKTAAPGAYPEGAFATLSDRMTGQPTGRTIAPEAVASKVQKDAAAKNLDPVGAETVELASLLEQGVTQVGGRVIADVLAERGGTQAVSNIRALESVKKLTKRLAELDGDLPNAGDKMKGRLEREKAVVQKLLEQKQGIIDAIPTGERIKNAFGSAVANLAGGLADVSDSVAILANRLDSHVPEFLRSTPNDGGVNDLKTAIWAKEIRDWAEKVTPTDPTLAEEFWTTAVPGAIGSATFFVLGGLAARAVGATATMSTLVLGMTGGGANGYRDAIANGAPEGAAWNSFLLNAGVGVTELAGVGSAIRRLDKASGGKIKKALLDAGIEGFEEVVQEFIQTTAGNAIAISLYDEQRELFEGSAEGAAAGGVAGVLTSLVISALPGKQRGGPAATTTTPPPAATAPGTPVAPGTPAPGTPSAGATDLVPPPAGTATPADAEEETVTLDNQAPKSFEFTNAKGETTIVEAVRESQAIAKLPADFGPIKGVKRVEPVAAPKPISEQPAAGGVSVAADSGTVAGKPTVPAITTPGGAQSPEAVVRGSDGISEGVPLAPISPEPKTDVADTNTPSAGITPTAPANPLLPPPVAASDKLRAPTAPTPAPGPAAAKPPAIARGTNKPQTFVSTVAKAANLKAKDKATRFLTDFAPRLHKANPQVFEAMEVHILNQAEWDSNPRTGANTPNSAAAYDPETNTMFFNSDKSKGDDVVDNVVHEMGHFAEKFALGEEFTQREWAKLQITQRIQADEQYKGRKLTPEEVRAFGAGIDNKRARSEWATMQFARVVKGDTDGMSTGMRARLEKFLELARELVRKWIGSKSLTTKELDAKILNVLGYAEKADIHTLVGKNSEGHEVYQDERGVRHVARIAANPDLLISEPVGMRPTRGPNGGIVYQADPRTSRERENTEFETTTEKGARTPAPVTTPRVADTTPAVAPKPAKSKVDDLADKLFDGLLGTPAVLITQEGFPKDRRQMGIELADAMIESGIKTPDAMASYLDSKYTKKARKFSDSLWSLFRFSEPSLPQAPDWNVLYAAIDNPAAPVDTTESNEPRSEQQLATDDQRNPVDRAGSAPAAGGGQPDSNAGNGARGGLLEGKQAENVQAPAISEPGSANITGESPLGQRAGGSQTDSAKLPDVQRGDGSGDAGQSPDGAGGRKRRRSGGASGGTGVAEQPSAPDRSNYRITDPESLVGGGPKTRFAKNRKSIETYQDLTAANRQPSAVELDTLASYIGWGSFGQELFQGSWDNPSPAKGWESESDWMRDYLGREEWESMQRSIINAHYTDPITVQTMWDMARTMGFTGGRVLEPGMGIGNFFGLMPADLAAKSQLTGIELDIMTGGMAKMLYPAANIQIKGYQDSKTADNFYDVVIGNWPFANIKIADRRYDQLSPSLHNYYFLKALDQVRPGGLIIGITSNSSMDQKTQGVRLALARKAELVGAYRLPAGAFEKYAGTKVVTDIIILKKRAEPITIEKAMDEGWITTVDRPTPSGTAIEVNEYWAKNPDNVLGRLNYGHGTTTGRPGMIVERPADYETLLKGLAKRVPKGAIVPWDNSIKRVTYSANDTKARQHSVVAKGAKFYQVQGEHLALLDDVVKWKVKDARKNEQRATELKGLIALREGLTKLLYDQSVTTGDLSAVRAKLKEQYDAFVAAHGPVSNAPMLSTMLKAGDFSARLLDNIEKKNAKGEWVPREILTTDIVRRQVRTENLSIEDAYAIDRYQNVNIDVTRIAKMSNSAEDQVIASLSESSQIFITPAGIWQARDEYLSGNVRQKVREAIDAKEQGVEGMDRNIEQLQAIMPKDVPYIQIEPQIGATWVRTDYYRQFIKHVLGLSEGDLDHVEITQGVRGYKVNLKRDYLVQRSEATTQWGHQDISWRKIIDAAMNNGTVKIVKHNEDGPYTDEKATKEANAKIDALREEFKTWLWSDPTRAIDLQTTYNETFNSNVIPDFDGSHLKLVGLSLNLGTDAFDFRAHQKNAIWRFLVHGRGVGAHEVGTGKTFTMAGLAMEARRLGLFRKPLIFAHNANSASIAGDMQLAYPGAKVLYVDNLSPANRDAALQQIGLDDWDAVVMPHSLVDRMMLREETMMAQARELIRELEQEAIDAAAEDNVEITVQDMDSGDYKKKLARTGATAKELVKQRERILETIRKQAQKARDDSVFFEDLGIDAVMVDEAHIFKKIPIATRQRLKGLNKAGSDRSVLLTMLTDYVKSKQGGKGVFMFTGTPITNTVNEAYNMMRYTMSDIMERDQVKRWDSWFNAFASSEIDVELTGGGTWEPVERLTQFVNVPELARFAAQVFDVVFAKDMPEFKPRPTKDGRDEQGNGRPFKQKIDVSVPMSAAQQEHVMDIRGRAQSFKSASGKEKKEIMLSGDRRSPIIYEGEGVKSALDYRMIDHTAPDDPTSKANAMVANAMEHFREHPKSAQMIFMERGYYDTVTRSRKNSDGTRTSFKVPAFNLAQDIINKLVAQGVPREQIVVFPWLSKEKRKLAAEAMRRGEVRFAIGGTETMGTGVNAQTELRAMHHLDAPWMPGELEQRNGRGWRQGNQWNTVLEYRYSTEGSHDGRRWQILLTKDKFIRRFMEAVYKKGETGLRIIDGDGADLSEGNSEEGGQEGESEFNDTFAAAVGDPRIMQRAKLQTKIESVERRRVQHIAAQRDAAREIERQRLEIERFNRNIAKLDQDAAQYQAQKPEPFSIEIQGKTYTERKDADAALTEIVEDVKLGTARTKVGEYAGFTLTVYRHKYGQTQVEFSGASAMVYEFSGSVQSLESNLRNLVRRRDNETTKASDAQRGIANLKSMLNSPFTRQAQLDGLKKQLEQIMRELTASPTPPPAWLRNGAPVGSMVVYNGRTYDVAAHRWDNSNWWLLVVDPEQDSAAMIPVAYDQVTDADGQQLFEAREFNRPPSVRVEGQAAPVDPSGPASTPNSFLKDEVVHFGPTADFWRIAEIRPDPEGSDNEALWSVVLRKADTAKGEEIVPANALRKADKGAVARFEEQTKLLREDIERPQSILPLRDDRTRAPRRTRLRRMAEQMQAQAEKLRAEADDAVTNSEVEKTANWRATAIEERLKKLMADLEREESEGLTRAKANNELLGTPELTQNEDGRQPGKMTSGIVGIAHDETVYGLNSKRVQADTHDQVSAPAQAFMGGDRFRYYNDSGLVEWQNGLPPKDNQIAVENYLARKGLRFAKHNDGFIGRDTLGTPPVKASPAQEAILAKVNGTLEDKRSIGQRMSDYLADLKDYVSTELKQKLLDSFASIKRLERATFGQGANLDASVSAYKAARLTKNLPSVMDYLMNHGSLEYRNGSMSMKPGAKGLLQIFKPLMDAGTLRLWEGYATAFRSDRLLQEGKETNFGRTQDPVTGQWTWDAATARREIDALLALGKQYPEFEVARQGYVEFQTSILDVAEGAGLIGADQRATWEKSDYVPFYRIAENLEGKGPGKRRGIADQRSGIKKLKGGAAPVAIMENIVRNIESLVDASFKNIAMQRVADLADGNNDMLVKIPYKAVPFKASVTEVLDELEKAGIDTSGLSTDEAAEFVRFWRMKAPKGKDVVSVMVDGKAIYYRVKDAALLRSVQSMGPRVHSWWMSALMAPKNALTALVTLDPEFMVANTIRDSFSAWVISDTPIKPGYDTAIGLLKSLRNDPSKLSVMAAGGGAGHYNNLREGRVRDYIRRLTPAARKTFLESIIDTPKKLGRIYADIGRATENANRLAIADSVKKRGGTDAEAAFQALDIMDFGLRGDSALLGFFLDTVPFLNARMQGLYKLGRASGIGQGDGATKYLPHARIATYGAIITGATLALLGSNWDDERYWELPEWERDIYYHFWLGGQHIRIPKPFEVGQILSTVPERMFEFMGKTGDGKLLAKRMLTMLSETFAMNPLPQVMKPAAERAMNFNTFTGLPIISRGDEFKQPEQQFNVFTSESLREMAEAMPDFAPEWMRSPKTLEHFVRGYFGSLGMYALTASDAITRAATGAPDDPEVKAGDWWVMKRFAPSSDMRETKYVAQFYDMHREITGLTRQIKELQKTAPEEARALQEANAQSLQFASRSDSTYSVLQSLRKQQEQIYASDDTPEGKRRRLAALATRRNQVAKGAVSAAPRTSSMPFNPFAR